jgi:carbohydrate diacid regulator
MSAEAEISGIINDIKEKTGIDITVYDAEERLIASTAAVPHPAVKAAEEEYEDGIYCGGGNCSFLFSSPSGAYVGIIDGCDRTAKNYAYMILSLLESSLTGGEKAHDRKHFAKMIITGEAAGAKLKKLLFKNSSLNMPCFVLSIFCEAEKQKDVLDFINHLAGKDDIALEIDKNYLAYIRFTEKNEGDYQSAMDFAQMLRDNIEQELSISVKVGVGSHAKNAFELASSYYHGQSALKRGLFEGSSSDIFSYREIVIMRMLEEIPEATLKKYLDILIGADAKEILGDPEMISTAEVFLENSLNISETSRNLYMHRNTLMYRLDKIEKVMGLNIRRFSDAVTFRLILMLYRRLRY